MPRKVEIGGVVAPAALFAGLGAWIAQGTPRWDTAVSHALAVRYASAGWRLWTVALSLGDPGWFVVGGAVVGLLAWRRRWADLVYYAAVLALSVVSLALLKHGFHRHSIRYGTKGYTGHSFPSGHATGSTAVALPVVFLLAGTRLRPAAFALAGAYVILVGLSLVALRIHFPTDVVAGWCLAAFWTSALWLARSRGAPRHAASE